MTAIEIKPYFVVGGLYSQANGVARIMRDLAAALGRAGAPVTVYGAECNGRHSIGDMFKAPTRWIGAPGRWLGGLSWSPALKRRMSREIEGADVVHNHSLWMLPNSYGSRTARAASKPVVITAHGTLEAWALNHSRWKKRIVSWLFQRRDLENADCIHVNSEQEIVGVRAFGLKCPVAVIPNGINLNEYDALPPASLFHDTYPSTRGKKIALFMARLHRKKGLEHLIRAWASLTREFSDWHMVIAGPDCGFGEIAKAMTIDLSIAPMVTFTGNLQGEMRLAALAAASMFVQPSFSEGFSMAVLEAMACHLPVLITPGCNFPEVHEEGAGVVVEPQVESTTTGWRKLLGLSDEDRIRMGNRARAMIEANHTWDAVAIQTLSLYRWLMRKGPAPSFIHHV